MGLIIWPSSSRKASREGGEGAAGCRPRLPPPEGRLGLGPVGAACLSGVATATARSDRRGVATEGLQMQATGGCGRLDSDSGGRSRRRRRRQAAAPWLPANNAPGAPCEAGCARWGGAAAHGGLCGAARLGTALQQPWLRAKLWRSWELWLRYPERPQAGYECTGLREKRFGAPCWPLAPAPGAQMHGLT